MVCSLPAQVPCIWLGGFRQWWDFSCYPLREKRIKPGTVPLGWREAMWVLWSNEATFALFVWLGFIGREDLGILLWLELPVCRDGRSCEALCLPFPGQLDNPWSGRKNRNWGTLSFSLGCLSVPLCCSYSCHLSKLSPSHCPGRTVFPVLLWFFYELRAGLFHSATWHPSVALFI